MYIFFIFIKSVFSGIELGLSMPLLSEKVLCFYNLNFVRLIRFLGGCSMLMFITQHHLCFCHTLQIFIVILATLQGIFMLFTLILSIVYSIEFIRNSRSFPNSKMVSDNICSSVLYSTLIIRICFIVFMECIGFLGFNYIIFEIIRGVVDIKKCLTKQ